MREFNYIKLKYQLWDSEILRLVAQIHECRGRQELFVKQKATQLSTLVEIAKVQSTEASNKIEGIVTTKSRIGQLMRKKTVPHNRAEEEILGYRDVLNTIHENFEYIPIKSNYILQLHKELYKYSASPIGGRYKNTQNYIEEIDKNGNAFIRFTPLEPFDTPSAIEKLCEQYNVALDKGEVDPLILIPTFILDFLCVHPFTDGNGRMSRLLTLLLLYKSGYIIGRYISIEQAIEKTKSSYYNALQQSSADWHTAKNDSSHFVKYILSILLSAYRDFESRVLVVENKLSTFELVCRAINSVIGKFTKSQLIELCPTISKASIENALKRLVEENKIQRNGSGKNVFYIKIGDTVKYDIFQI